MRTSRSILLIDIDSVLVEPLGYRAALMATLQHFADLFGIKGSYLPDVDTIEYFEAMHITSEWDMAPIVLAVLINHLADTIEGYTLPQSLDGQQKTVRSYSFTEVDYRHPIDYISKHLVNGEYPASTALRLSGPHLSDNGNIHPGIFPYIAGSKLIDELFSTSRDPYKSKITRIFQHYTLSSQIFSQVYGLEPEIQTNSLLKTCDRSLLQPEVRDNLLSLYDQGVLAAVALTNRPSYPPKELGTDLKGYPPEAELALDLSGLSQIPLIGFGRLRFVAEQHGLDIEDLLKPSPVHPLAAIFTALTRQEYPSIQIAIELGMGSIVDRENRSSARLDQIIPELPEKIDVHIYEDTRWGIDATYQASEILHSVGLSNQIYAWGIATNQQKVFTLQRAGAKVFPNISEALKYSVL